MTFGGPDIEPMGREDNPIKRHYVKPTRKTAINAKCATCVGCTSVEQGNGQEDHLEKGFRHEIKHCTSLACPLFSYRPYQDKRNVKDQI
jgi:hypothetical protein